jgi:hypothetical protein
MRAVEKLRWKKFSISVLPEDHPRDPTITGIFKPDKSAMYTPERGPVKALDAARGRKP